MDMNDFRQMIEGIIKPLEWKHDEALLTHVAENVFFKAIICAGSHPFMPKFSMRMFFGQKREEVAHSETLEQAKQMAYKIYEYHILSLFNLQVMVDTPEHYVQRLEKELVELRKQKASFNEELLSRIRPIQWDNSELPEYCHAKTMFSEYSIWKPSTGEEHFTMRIKYPALSPLSTKTMWCESFEHAKLVAQAHYNNTVTSLFSL